MAMTVRTFSQALLASSVCVLAMGAPLHAPAPDSQKVDALARTHYADLFDPRLIAQNICSGESTHRSSPIIQAAVANTPAAAHAPRSPLFEGLGTLTYKVTTASPQAQAFFDQGLRLFYAFNPGEAVASFRAASDADASCAMCYWGEALTLGPNLNGQPRDTPAALATITKARALADNVTPRERALIDAVAARFSTDGNVKHADLDLAYADAMAKVYAAHKDDSDIAAIYAEAAMNVHSAPWNRWWDKTGRVPTGYLAGAIAAIEDTLARNPEHPGAIHLYIHAMDGSVFQEKAEPHADKLAALMPNAGHMVHMPAHTFFNLGRYKDALTTNVAAIAVDDAYLKGPAAASGVYRYGLYQHNVHFALAAADMAGDADSALRLAKIMNDFQAHNTVARFDVSAAAAIHPVVRFQTPEDMLALPKPEAKRPYMRGIWHYARGSAYAYQNKTREALREANTIDRLRSGKKPQATGLFGDLLGVAAEVVRGRVAASDGQWIAAAEHFAKAAAFQDRVEYRDPPFWDFPVRQAQGVALYRAGKLQQAAEVLRQALLESPNSGYALYAIKEVSAALGDTIAAEEYAKLFEKAWAGTAPPDLNRL
jgi:tetratricopeptide (TPR) repeat protein